MIHDSEKRLAVVSVVCTCLLVVALLVLACAAVMFAITGPTVAFRRVFMCGAVFEVLALLVFLLAFAVDAILEAVRR